MIFQQNFRRKGASTIAKALVFVSLCFASFASCAGVPIENARSAGVAIWDLEDLSVDEGEKNIGELLSAQITEVLQQKGELTVIDRTRLERVLEELHLGSSALANDQTRLKLGKLVGARYMIFGGYQVLAGRIRIDIRMVDVETGKVLKAVQKTSTASGLSVWMKAAREAGSEL